MKDFAILLLMVATLLPACRKKSGPPASTTPPAEQVAAQFGVDPTALPSQAVLYDAISRYMAANQGRAAKDVKELVEKGFLKPLPALPPGKRYDLDQRGVTLRIVD